MIGAPRRPGRRFIALILFLCAFITLWNTYGFWILPPRFLSRSRTYQLDGGIRYVTGSYDWGKARVFHPPPTDIQSPPAGPPKTFPPVQKTKGPKPTDEQKKVAIERRDIIRDKFKKSWDAYAKYAWGRDELTPLSKGGKKSLSAWGAQIVDALDTLWIMDFKDEFRAGVDVAVTIDWSRTSDWTINVFEVTIRYLGGLLAAHDLSGEPALLAKAVELGDTLYAAFDTPNRLPVRWLNLGKAARGRQVADIKASGASAGTLCLEFTRLSQLTGDPKYYDATERVKQFFRRWQPETKIPGLWPIMINYKDEVIDAGRFGVGAGADSLYEYLPKMHMLLGGLDADYEEMTTRSLDAIRDYVLYKPMTPTEEDILMSGIASLRGGKVPQITPDMQHLACFAGGMYALTAQLMKRSDYLDLGARLTQGCVWAYSAFPTGIMPEKARMVACKKQGHCPFRKLEGADESAPDGYVRIIDRRFLLRPEAIESVFYMWRITGEQVWRDAAWTMWEAIVKETETDEAFASIEDVTEVNSEKVDSMETFWIGETLKYFYLIFADEDVISLDEWILNTEAHPFRRPTK